MRARLDGFLLDNFLFEFLAERFGEDNSRNGVPEAVTDPHAEANCRVKRCVRRSKLGKAIANANRIRRAMLCQASAPTCSQTLSNAPFACFRSGGSAILRVPV
jgi:hypothetical protein